MADVRLTATNPEDSSVVPVACDAAGRLLLEEPQVIEGPPGQQGPPGEQGPPGQDGQDGDPFSGNFADDVTFGGSAEFAGDRVKINATGDYALETSTFAKIDNGVLVQRSASNQVRLGTTDPSQGNKEAALRFTDGFSLSHIYMNGDAEFAGTFSASGDRFTTSANGQINVNYTSSGSHALRIKTNAANPAFVVNADGSVEFATGKAGFTEEGYLWCTTRRGDTVILDATSNGLASWVEYSPTTLREEIRDKLDANSGDTGENATDTP